MRPIFLSLLLLPFAALAACGGSNADGNETAAELALKPEPTETPTPEPTPTPTPTPEPVSPAYRSPEHGEDGIQKLVALKFRRGAQSSNKIALTFDDGPHPRRTPRILAYLQEAGVPATFFWLGNMVEKYANVARMVDEAGHEVGSHTWSHANLNERSLEESRKEIVETQDIIEATIGKRPRLFRPPYGNSNPRVEQICEQEGLVICMWSVDTVDWKSTSSAASIQQLVAEQTGNGSVILMHDIQERTVEALPAMLAQLKEAGYEFVPLSELILESVRLGEEQQEESDAPASSYGEIETDIDEELVIPLDASEF